METINLGASDGLPPVDWSEIAARLDAGSAPAPDAHNSRTTWLTTINEDGSPHVTAVGAIRSDDSYWFQTGTGTRKHRNLDRDPRCSLATSILGADVVIEGVAVPVRDTETLTKVAEGWAATGWPAELDPSEEGIRAPFNAPGQGAPPWHVYRLAARSATVVLSDEPGGLTRFRF